MYKKNRDPHPLGKVEAEVRRVIELRDERDAAVKAAAAMLAGLEATVDSDTATQAEINYLEEEYLDQIDAFVDLAVECVHAEANLSVLTVIKSEDTATA